MADPRRRLPSVDAVLRSERARAAERRFGRSVLRRAVRDAVDAAREEADRGRPPPSADAIVRTAVAATARAFDGLTPVLNATGVVLHTNLGRAPLPEIAVRAAARAARSYTDLEVELASGRRGRRTSRVELLLASLTGADDALVVNNNAAALLLALSALASKRDVLVSRGELIEIGGAFRLPEIMAASGARLVEVGTTNRTTLRDYERAISRRTALVLKVHPSNYRVVGFHAAPEVSRLAALAKEAAVPLLHDTGSGLLARVPGIPREEPAADESLRAGADLVCFSGDKLLGGPQAGIVVGAGALVERLRSHPIARAVRVDKMTIAALEAVVAAHAKDGIPDLPVWRSLTASTKGLRSRARVLAAQLPRATVVAVDAAAGGGSLPGFGVPSVAVRVPTGRPAELAALLRRGRPPVFCRASDDALLFDVRTVDAKDDERLLGAIRAALARSGS